jgi:hypothetical protein
MRTVLLALTLALPSSLAWADCIQRSTGVIDCNGATGYPLGNSDNVYVPGAGFQTYQPETYQPQWAAPRSDSPEYPQPESSDNPQQ